MAPVYAKPMPDPAPAAMQRRLPPPEISVRPSQEQEIALLKEQIRLIDHYQESQLSIVLWSLGGVVGLAILLSGFSWWTNFRLNENDRKNLMKEVEQLSATLQKSTELSVIKSLANTAAEIRSEMTALRDLLQKRYDESKDGQSKADKKITDLAKQIIASDVQLRLVEEYVWDTRKNQYNVLLTQVQGANSAREAEDYSQAKLVLERMKNTLNRKVIPSGEKFSEEDIKFLMKWLGELTQVDAILVAEICDLISKTEKKRHDQE